MIQTVSYPKVIKKGQNAKIYAVKQNINFDTKEQKFWI